VQIFTRRGEGRPAFSAGAGGGTYGTSQYDAGVYGSTGGEHSVSYALGGAREEADGFSSTRPRASTYNRDDDGYTRTSANARLALRLADGHEIGAQFFKSRLSAQYDNGSSSFDARNQQEVDSYAVFLNDRIAPHWRSSLQAARSEDKLGSFTSTLPAGTSQLNTRQDEFTWQNTFDLGGDTLQVLAGHRKETVLSSSIAALDKSRITNSVAAAYNLRRGSHLLDVSVRNDHAEYGSKTTGAAGYGYELTKNLRATASLGTSFRAPTFNELYYPGYGFVDNQPERGRNIEAGLQYRVAGVDLKADYYRNRLTDLIVSLTPCPTRTGSCAYNVNHALLEGLTLAADTRIGNLMLRASADLQDPRDETADKQLARRARRHASIAADYDLGQVDAGVELQASSRRFDDAANANRLGGFTTMDVYAAWQFAPAWSVQAKVNNLADRKYETAMGYNQAGRSLYVTLRWQPK
jgi:vitamin B12 transporter